MMMASVSGHCFGDASDISCMLFLTNKHDRVKRSIYLFFNVEKGGNACQQELYCSADVFSLPGASLKSVSAVAEKDSGALNRDLYLQ